MKRAFALLMLALTCLAVRAVHACKTPGLQSHLSDETRRATDAQAPRFTSPPTIVVQRGVSRDGCDQSATSCDDRGLIRIKVPVSDDQTPEAECGFRLSLISGTLPGALQLPAHDVRAFHGSGIEGELLMAWHDPGGQASFSFVLSVAPVDAAANVGEAVTLSHSTDDGGCAVVPGARSGMCLVLLVALWGGLRQLGRRHRWRRRS